MAKTEEEKAAAQAEKEAQKAAAQAETSAPVKNARQVRWEAFLVQHEKQNPEKHAARREAGELDEIPDSFI